MSVAHFMTVCILGVLIDWYLPSLVAQPGEAGGGARLQLAHVGRVLVLDGRHVLGLHVLEREVLDGDAGPVLLGPAQRAGLDGLVGGLDVGLEDPQPQARALLHGGGGVEAQRQRQRGGGAGGAGEEVTAGEASIGHGGALLRRDYRPGGPALSRAHDGASTHLTSAKRICTRSRVPGKSGGRGGIRRSATIKSRALRSYAMSPEDRSTSGTLIRPSRTT